MFKFDADAFKTELIKLDGKTLHDIAQAYSYGYTDVLALTYGRVDKFCKLYHFMKNIIDCDWGYDINFLTGMGSGVPKQAALYEYVISFNTPEDGQQPYILLNSLIYGVYDVCNMLYERFGMVPNNCEDWLANYVTKVIFFEKDLYKLDKFINDPHVCVSNDTYKTLLSRAVAEEWVEATALMLRFMHDNGIYEEQETLRL